jgi:Sec-independent protein translocase protein TatA
MVSEFLVLGVIGSIVLGPKKMVKLSADASRLMQKFKSVQQDFTRQLETELNPSPIAPSALSIVEPGAPVHPPSHEDVTTTKTQE